MPLSAEQLQLRTLGVGASEVPALVLPPGEVPGGRGMGSVWLTKRRGKHLELDPIVEPEPEPDTCDAFLPFIKGDVRTAGNILESGLVQLYETMTGLTCTPANTVVHAHHRYEMATPDRYVHSVDSDGDALDRIDRGLECKLVGWRMADHWPDDGVPDYVRIQCQWGMWVTGIDRWDVMALIGGSDPRVVRIERDDDLIRSLHEVVTEFWESYVLENRVPPATSPDDAMRVLGAVHRAEDGTIVDAPPAARELVQALLEAQEDAADAETRIGNAKAQLCAIVGGRRGIIGPWGKFLWYGSSGRPSWKSIAEELAGGIIPEALIEKHRGDSFRMPRLYAAKKGKGGRR